MSTMKTTIDFLALAKLLASRKNRKIKVDGNNVHISDSKGNFKCESK